MNISCCTTRQSHHYVFFCVFTWFFSQNFNWQNLIKLHDPLFHVWDHLFVFVFLKVDRSGKGVVIFKCSIQVFFCFFALSWVQSNRVRCVSSDSRQSSWRWRRRKSRGRTIGHWVRTYRDRPRSVTQHLLQCESTDLKIDLFCLYL